MVDRNSLANRVIEMLKKEVEFKTPTGNVFAKTKSLIDSSCSNQQTIKIDPEKNCKTCGHMSCLFYKENQNPVYKHCWFAPESVENTVNMEVEGKFYGGIPAGQTVFISANTSKDRTQIPPTVTVTGQRGTTPVFFIDSMSEYESVTNGRGLMRSSRILDDYAYRFIEDLTEQERLEKRLKANEKVLRKHPARKDLFLENRTLRERIKELKRKDK